MRLEQWQNVFTIFQQYAEMIKIEKERGLVPLLFFAKITYSFMKKGVMFMLKIIKNNSCIKELQRHKYILYTEVNGKPAYAKIGLRQIFGYIALKIKYI